MMPKDGRGRKQSAKKNGKRRNTKRKDKENIHTKLIWFTSELSTLLN